jgi:hypothetical protein
LDSTKGAVVETTGSIFEGFVAAFTTSAVIEERVF